MDKIDNILAEIDTYTDYCKLIDYQVAKAQEFIDKNAALIMSQAMTVVAAFPYGVGPAIIAAKLQATQILLAAEDIQEQIQVPLKIIEKLSTLTPPEGGC